MTDHKLMPKHGEELVIAEHIGKEKLKAIFKAQQMASLDLGAAMAVVLINDKQHLMLFPCKQCLRDTALQFRDLSELLLELVDGSKSSR